MNYEKVSTLNKKYLLRELRDGFDTVEKEGLTLEMATRTGFEETANFSQKCEVVVAPEDGKFKVGQTVFVHHLIVSDKYKNDWFDETLYATVEPNIWFAGEKPEDMVSDDLVIFKYLAKEVKEGEIITDVCFENELKGEVVSGAYPKGTEITYRLNKELEFFFNEQQYLITEKAFITSCDGVPVGDWYEFDDFEDDYFNCGFIDLKGQTGISKKLGIELKKNQKIVRLHNECLPLDGQLAVIGERFTDNYVNANLDFYVKYYHDVKGSRGIYCTIEGN